MHKKVVCTVTLLQEGPGFVSMLGLFYVKLACSPCACGFSAWTSTSPHSPKRCFSCKLMILNPQDDKHTDFFLPCECFCFFTMKKHCLCCVLLFQRHIKLIKSWCKCKCVKCTSVLLTHLILCVAHQSSSGESLGSGWQTHSFCCCLLSFRHVSASASYCFINNQENCVSQVLQVRIWSPFLPVL